MPVLRPSFVERWVGGGCSGPSRHPAGGLFGPWADARSAARAPRLPDRDLGTRPPLPPTVPGVDRRSLAGDECRYIRNKSRACQVPPSSRPTLGGQKAPGFPSPPQRCRAAPAGNDTVFPRVFRDGPSRLLTRTQVEAGPRGRPTRPRPNCTRRSPRSACRSRPPGCPKPSSPGARRPRPAKRGSQGRP